MAEFTLPTGEFDRLVQLQLNTPVVDAATNAQQDAWADYGAPIWARWMESVGQAPAGAADDSVEQYGRPIEVWLYWFASFDRDRMRVVNGSRILRIVASAEVGRMRYIKLACVEWANV